MVVVVVVVLVVFALLMMLGSWVGVVGVKPGVPFQPRQRVMKYKNPTLKPCHFKENKSLKITIYLLVVRSLPSMGNLQFTPRST